MDLNNKHTLEESLQRIREIMACGCGKGGVNKTMAQQVQTGPKGIQQILEELSATDESLVKVTYNGSGSYSHSIPSKSGKVIAYGSYNYGMGRNGDVIWVHKSEVEKAPSLFVPVSAETLEVDVIPETDTITVDVGSIPELSPEVIENITEAGAALFETLTTGKVTTPKTKKKK